MKRSVYGKKLKMAAAKHAQNVSMRQPGKLGISGTTVRRWINEYDELRKCVSGLRERTF